MKKVKLVYPNGYQQDITEEYYAAGTTYQFVQDMEYLTGAEVQFGEVK